MVTSKPITSQQNQQGQYKTQVVKGDDIAGGAIIMAWIFGVVAPLLISTFGNYVAFIGGWNNLSWAIPWQLVAYAVIYQVACSACQLLFKAMAKRQGGFNPWWVAYIVALFISVVPSIVGYFGPIYAAISQPILDYAAKQQVVVSEMMLIPIIALFVGVGCAILDVLPEWIAVE